MLFSVTGVNIDSGYTVPADQVAGIIRQAVVPSFEKLASLAATGKLKGGLFPGERGGAFVVETDSFEELDEMMNQLPFFGLVRWEVKPLMPFDVMAKKLPGYLANMNPGG